MRPIGYHFGAPLSDGDGDYHTDDNDDDDDDDDDAARGEHRRRAREARGQRESEGVREGARETTGRSTDSTSFILFSLKTKFLQQLLIFFSQFVQFPLPRVILI